MARFEKNSIPWNKGLARNEETKKKISQNRLGKGLKGKIPSKNAGQHRAQKLFIWIKCELCGSKPESRNQIRHHKNGNTLDNRKENIQFLCRKCHPKIHNHGIIKELLKVKIIKKVKK